MIVKKHKQPKSARPVKNKDSFSLVSDEKLLQIYTAMVKCRMLAKEVEALSQQGKLAAGVRAAAGNEAIVTGLAIDLLPDDVVSSTRHDLAASLLKGLPLETIISRVMASRRGRRKSPGRVHADRSLHGILPPSSTLAGQLNVACGVALANLMAKNGRIVTVFCEGSDDPTETCGEALAFAGANKLPVLFVCHSDSHPEPEAAAHARPSSLADTSLACGVPAITVDGNDAVAVYRVAYESITRARQGRGPTLIACGMNHHDLARYLRTKSRGTQRVGPNDPIRNMEVYLTRKDLFNARLKRRITAAFGSELDAAIQTLAR